MIIVGFDQLNVAVMISSSPVRLTVGGSAMFVRLASSHHVVIRGRMSWSPRASTKVRV